MFAPLVSVDDKDVLRVSMALALLDCEVKRGADESSEPESHSERLRRQGRLWNCEELEKEASLFGASEGAPDPYFRDALNQVFGREATMDANGGLVEKTFGLGSARWTEVASEELHFFVHSSLRRAMEFGAEPKDAGGSNGDYEERRAGALYLYNDRADELVMAASEGFPLRSSIVHVGSSDEIQLPHNPAQARGSQVTLTGQTAASAFRGIRRLEHLNTKVAPYFEGSTIARAGWLTGELRAYCRTSASVPHEFDCNKTLVGIAFYKTGGAGITAQLFDRAQGPELERIFLAGETKAEPGYSGEEYRNCVEHLFPAEEWTGFRKSFLDHLQKHLLEDRTLVFQRRSEMGAGRKDTAGVYEGLQFPSSECIGPFLGTVLRFNGEHLGILKVERWYIPESLGGGASEKLPPAFSARATARFLVYAYALAGTLYVLKHHFGLDLSKGWRRCDCQESLR